MASGRAVTAIDVFYIFSVYNLWPPNQATVDSYTKKFSSVDEMRRWASGHLRRASNLGKVPTWVLRYLGPEMGSKVGYLAIPELARILFAGASLGWDAGKVQSHIESSRWWKAHNETQRGWIGMSPADQNRLITQTAVRMAADWQSMNGKAIDFKAFIKNGTARKIASGEADFMVWEAQNRTIAARDPNSPAGRDAANEQKAERQHGVDVENTGLQLRQALERDFLVPASDATISKWASDIIDNKASEADFEGWARGQAASLYPGFADQINRGVNPSTLLSPYTDLASSELERTVDFADPLVRGATMTPDLTPLWQFRQQIRQTPQWRQTSKAMGLASDFALNLLNQFGEISA